MNVLVDRHHAGLYHSLQLLGVRLGWTVYTPTGHEWWDEDYWEFGRGTWPDDRLAQQYLLAEQVPDPEFPDWPINFVTLGEARTMDWAYIVATLQDNQVGFARFAREMGAKFALAVGNTNQYIDWTLDPLVLMAAEMPIAGKGIRYHQEMDPIAFVPPFERHRAASFVNCMTSMGPCWDLLAKAQASVPINVYGIDGPDGVVKPLTATLELMSRSGWGWHDKAHGDGFGHVLHMWAAIGRPLVGHGSHYRGKMGERFWRHGETCIDLDLVTIEEAVEMILSMPPGQHDDMCRAIRAEFDTSVDYDAEADSIRALLA